MAAPISQFWIHRAQPLATSAASIFTFQSSPLNATRIVRTCWPGSCLGKPNAHVQVVDATITMPDGSTVHGALKLPVVEGARPALLRELRIYHELEGHGVPEVLAWSASPDGATVTSILLQKLPRSLAEDIGIRAAKYAAAHPAAPRPTGDSALYTSDELWRIVSGLATALQEAHWRGVYHMDVKPPNVLLTHDGSPIIADWGISLMRPRTPHVPFQVKGPWGTPGFCVPALSARNEVVDVTVAADMQPLAVTAACMLLNVSADHVRDMHSRGELGSMIKHPELFALVNRTLIDDPWDLPSMADFIKDSSAEALVRQAHPLPHTPLIATLAAPVMLGSDTPPAAASGGSAARFHLPDGLLSNGSNCGAAAPQSGASPAPSSPEDGDSAAHGGLISGDGPGYHLPVDLFSASSAHTPPVVPESSGGSLESRSTAARLDNPTPVAAMCQGTMTPSTSSSWTINSPMINPTSGGLEERCGIQSAAGHSHAMSRFGGVSDVTCDTSVAEADTNVLSALAASPSHRAHRLGSGALSTTLGSSALGDSRMFISFRAADLPSARTLRGAAVQPPPVQGAIATRPGGIDKPAVEQQADGERQRQRRRWRLRGVRGWLRASCLCGAASGVQE